MKKLIAFLSVALCSIFLTKAIDFEPYFPFKNLSYVVYKAPAPVQIDGNIYTEEWEKAPWTEDFQDIQGDRNPVKPKYRTRAKILWDKDYLYCAVELQEPNIWATVKEHDQVIYADNDIEFFIDPTGGCKNYYEFEFNALNTIWELLLSKPYYRGGRSFSEWDPKGIKTGVKIYGTLNDPSDTDDKWTFEAAIPFSMLGGAAPGRQWRMDFSRVEYLHIKTENGKYVKEKGFPEENWLWSPTGAIDAHRPERWGWLQFSGITVGDGTEEFNWNNGHEYQEALWTASNRIRQYRAITGQMPKNFKDLEMENPMNIKYIILADNQFYLSVLSNNGCIYYLTNEGLMNSYGAPAPNVKKKPVKPTPPSKESLRKLY